MPILKLKDAEKARDAITNAQKKQIADLYKNWAKEIEAKAEYYARKDTASAPISAQQMRELNEMLINTSDVVYSEIETGIKQNMYQVSASVLENNSDWLQSLGFPTEGINIAFNHVPDMIVRNISTGQIYDTGWSLSAKIWGDKQATLKDAYGIIAKGRACNMSSYEVAKELEKYVNPSVKKQWNPTLKYLKRDKDGNPILDANGKLVYEKGPRIYKKSVDYNAQRLARTLTQHAYQQSFVATTQKNPFIEYYVWRANGSRACELCLDRDGQKFAKDELPLDHPNGMCTMDLSTDPNMIDRLADWINEPEGTYPEIDEFAENFGNKDDFSFKMPKGFDSRIDLYVGGGYSGPEDVLNNKDIAYINTHMEESSKNAHFYRVEDMRYTASQLDNDLKDIDEFDFNGLRSFTKSKDVISEMLDENSDNYAGIYEPVIFDITGTTKYFDMKDFTESYTMMDQQEVLINGQFEVVGDGMIEMNGEWVRLIKVRQL